MTLLDTGLPARPFTEDDAFIERALEDASIPTLMMAIIHMTGDTSLLDGPIKIASGANWTDLKSLMSDADQKTIRALGLKVIKEHRDRGCPAPPPLSEDTLRRMSSFIVGETVPDEYLPMMYEEMGIDEKYTRPIPWSGNAAKERKKDFQVIIIGAGMGGMLCAIKLNELGIPFTVIEKADGVGGTWRDNTYPGCRVDTPNHFYSYSFEPNPYWTQYFSGRDELLPYFQSVAKKYDIEKNIRFKTEVVEATWLEAEALWEVKVRRDDGSTDVLLGNTVVTAVGTLSRPKIPNIPGRETFKGRQSHTHGWDRGIELKGKRVAVIGTASTALQVIPECANVASKLFVFQRTAHWFWPTPNYLAKVADGQKWLLAHIPGYSSWYRFTLLWALTDGIRDWFKIDPDWPNQERSVSAVNEQFRIQFTDFFKDALKERPDLLEKLIPKFPPFADRMSLNDGLYLKALQQDHVELVTNSITSIDETGITDTNGIHYDVDVIVYATGFYSDRFLFPMRIVGKNGVVLNDFWDGEGRAYLGVTVPEFPNFFMVWGPGTSGGTGGSTIFFSECHNRYVRSAIQQMIEHDAATMECRWDVFDEYVKRYRAEVDTMVWSTPTVHSWYKNEKGRVVSTLTWRLIDYWKWTKTADLSDFHITTKSAHASAQNPRRRVSGPA